VKAWARAEPLYAEAARLYAARGDRRNAVFAEINRLRGELPRLPVPKCRNGSPSSSTIPSCRRTTMFVAVQTSARTPVTSNTSVRHVRRADDPVAVDRVRVRNFRN
jgi:hypothetical protein